MPIGRKPAEIGRLSEASIGLHGAYRCMFAPQVVRSFLVFVRVCDWNIELRLLRWLICILWGVRDFRLCALSEVGRQDHLG